MLKLPDPKLPRAEFADSTRVQVGQPVVAIGSPHGQQGSVTVGVISALHRTIRAGAGGSAAETLPDVLQTDAPINPGNSGGPLADAAGHVIGVNTAAGTGNSIGYAIGGHAGREGRPQGWRRDRTRGRRGP
ncbi:MAG TPA: trypsin-like peptidase domain-containing protein [Candidatus Acidoferrales bacterium]|nr:trypsin-like peptidase domain-containing protein [Candidatus Acidoferrales bacterium]